MNKRSLRIGILGTRGIPNRYGGFEECAEQLGLGLVRKGHNVSVYNSGNHEYKQAEWNGIHIIHCSDPEDRLGTVGQFFYDLNCLRDARQRNFDILLQLGYTSSSIWYQVWPRGCVNIVNMDGLEWKRTKYKPPVRKFLKFAEKLAAVHADVLVADSLGIQAHLQDSYGKQSTFIPYGATVFDQPDPSCLQHYGLTPHAYHLVIARMERENNIEMIIEGHRLSQTVVPLVVVGNTTNEFGGHLRKEYASDKVLFTEGIYDDVVINNLRYYSLLYFHGHSVGGTNPSLLEAMGCRARICAHDNTFNKTVLQEDALYFSSPDDIAYHIQHVTYRSIFQAQLDSNVEKIRSTYNWEKVTDQYERLMLDHLALSK